MLTSHLMSDGSMNYLSLFFDGCHCCCCCRLSFSNFHHSLSVYYLFIIRYLIMIYVLKPYRRAAAPVNRGRGSGKGKIIYLQFSSYNGSIRTYKVLDNLSTYIAYISLKNEYKLVASLATSLFSQGRFAELRSSITRHRT